MSLFYIEEMAKTLLFEKKNTIVYGLDYNHSLSN